MEEITERQLVAVLLSGTAIGALASWGLVAGFRDGGKPIDLLALLQTVGSFLAIAVAFFVPIRLFRAGRRLEKERDVIRARSFALTVLPEIEQFRMHLRSAQETIEAGMRPEEDIKLEEAGNLAEPPEALRNRLSMLHELGEPATHIQRAIAKTAIARERLYQWDFYYTNGGVYHDPLDRFVEDMAEPDDYSEPLKEALEHVDRAIKDIGEMFD